MTREAKVKLCNYISLKSGERTENIVLVHATMPKGLCELDSSELCLPFGWWSQDLWYQRDQAFCCSSVKSELIQYLWNQQTHPITGMSILDCCSSCAACCQKLIVPQCPTTFSLTENSLFLSPSHLHRFPYSLIASSRISNINVVPPSSQWSVLLMYFFSAQVYDIWC